MRNLTAVVAAFSVGAAALSLAVTAPAQAAETLTLTNPTSNVENLTADGISGILKELGATQIEVKDVEGQKVVYFQSGTTPFNLGITLCDVRPGTCLGLIMLVGFDPGATHYPLELFNTFNKSNPYATAVQLDGNRFAVARMMITDGGVTKLNLASNIAAFAGAPEAIMRFLASQLVAGNDKDKVVFAPVSQGGALNTVNLSPADVVKIARAQAQSLVFPKAPTLKR